MTSADLNVNASNDAMISMSLTFAELHQRLAAMEGRGVATAELPAATAKRQRIGGDGARDGSAPAPAVTGGVEQRDRPGPVSGAGGMKAARRAGAAPATAAAENLEPQAPPRLPPPPLPPPPPARRRQPRLRISARCARHWRRPRRTRGRFRRRGATARWRARRLRLCG